MLVQPFDLPQRGALAEGNTHKLTPAERRELPFYERPQSNASESRSAWTDVQFRSCFSCRADSRRRRYSEYGASDEFLQKIVQGSTSRYNRDIAQAHRAALEAAKLDASGKDRGAQTLDGFIRLLTARSGGVHGAPGRKARGADPRQCENASGSA